MCQLRGVVGVVMVLVCSAWAFVVKNDQEYGRARTVSGQEIALLMDVYHPEVIAPGSPLFITVHGGGFTSGDKKKGLMVSLCTTMVKKGIVCASINYRLSDLGRSWSGGRIDTVKVVYQSIYRAIEDCRTAMAFLLAHYPVDRAKVILSGGSAGAITVLQVALPEQASLMRLIDTAGCSNAGSPHYRFVKPLGVINLWGALLDSGYLRGSDVRILSIHGTKDSTVPFGIGRMGPNDCIPSFGSGYIHPAANTLGIVSELFADTVGHGQFPDRFVVQKSLAFVERSLGTTGMVPHVAIAPTVNQGLGISRQVCARPSQSLVTTGFLLSGRTISRGARVGAGVYVHAPMPDKMAARTQ